MAVKDLVFDKKKLTMAELKKALAANFEGEYEKVHKMCYQDAPKHGNDIPEVNKMLHRVNDSILKAFNNVDGGGNYISKDIKTSLDQYTKSVHNLMGMVTGALPTGKKAGVALTDGSLSAMPGTDVNGPTALVMSAAKGNDHVKWCATHMNMKLPPDQLKTRKGRDNVMNLVRTLFTNEGYHIQFNVLDTEKLRDAQKHPENYRDLVVRVAGFSAFFTKLHKGVQDEIIERTLQRLRSVLTSNGTGTAWRSVTPYRRFLDSVTTRKDKTMNTNTRRMRRRYIMSTRLVMQVPSDASPSTWAPASSRG